MNLASLCNYTMLRWQIVASFKSTFEHSDLSLQCSACENMHKMVKDLGRLIDRYMEHVCQQKEHDVSRALLTLTGVSTMDSGETVIANVIGKKSDSHAVFCAASIAEKLKEAGIVDEWEDWR